MGPRKTRKRFEHKNELRFLTFSCYRRLALYNNPNIRARFVQQIRDIQLATRFQLVAWVIMPEHIHLLLMPQFPDHPIDIVLDKMKGPFAKEVLARWRELNAPILPRVMDSAGKYHFWQVGGGYDRNIFSREEAEEKFHYIHHNPVKRQLVKRAVDWRWSSARWYEYGDDDWGLQMSPDLIV